MDNALTPVVLQFEATAMAIPQQHIVEKIYPFNGKMKVFLCGESFPVTVEVFKEDTDLSKVVYLGIIDTYKIEGSSLHLLLTNDCELTLSLDSRKESEEFTFTNLLAFCSYTVGNTESLFGDGMELEEVIETVKAPGIISEITRSHLLSPLSTPNPF